MKTRLQALGLLDRALAATTDAELDALVAGLGEDHREVLERIAEGSSADAIRAAAVRGRLDGGMENIAMVLADACLADCIEQLGENADHPTEDELADVLPGIVERHGVSVTRIMLASTVVGEAPAAPILRTLLKSDDLVKLPPVEPRPIAAAVTPAEVDTAEREAVRAKRRAAREQKRIDANARREQAARDRSRR